MLCKTEKGEQLLKKSDVKLFPVNLEHVVAVNDQLREPSLKTKKHGPVHILDDLNLALPERAWLTGLRQKDQNIEVLGSALDNQTISLFIASLEKFPYFAQVGLNQSTEYSDPESSARLMQFSLNIGLKNPLKVQTSASTVDGSSAPEAGKDDAETNDKAGSRKKKAAKTKKEEQE